MKPYREWLTTNHYEAKASVGGSHVPDSVEGYYLSPWDLGYGPFVKFDHDFIGRAALEKMADGPHRKKVTLELDSESVTDAIYSQFQKEGLRAKYMEFPSAVYSMHPFDRVEKDGELVGLSTWISYSANEGKMLTLAIVDEAYAEPGTVVDFIWGEPGGGTTKPTVEPHKQVTIKAIVAAVPYSEAARTSYAKSWRNETT
jgi:syringate O-demethylase